MLIDLLSQTLIELGETKHPTLGSRVVHGQGASLLGATAPILRIDVVEHLAFPPQKTAKLVHRPWQSSLSIFRKSMSPARSGLESGFPSGNATNAKMLERFLFPVSVKPLQVTRRGRWRRVNRVTYPVRQHDSTSVRDAEA